MARETRDREDILREATALVERAELSLGGAEPIVAGFRRDGSISFYFGSDPVYQFNAAGQLRRAYVDGHLIKAEQGRLARLRRQQGEGQVELLRHDLDEPQTEALLDRMRSDLVDLRQAIVRQQYVVRGQRPEDRDIVGRIGTWLEGMGESIAIANSPGLRSKGP